MLAQDFETEEERPVCLHAFLPLRGTPWTLVENLLGPPSADVQLLTLWVPGL